MYSSYPQQPFPFASAVSMQPAGTSAFPTSGAGSIHFSDASTNSGSLASSMCREFTYQSLFSATGGFRSSNIIGKGSFGAVYRGTLDDQTDVAIKVISDPQLSGFDDEIRMLVKYRHPNLVMLLGYAKHGNTRLLVYEYLVNGDCEKRLRDPDLSSTFVWQQRLSVLVDACRGIAFMISSRALHRDIKPSNILLDKNFTAKMADFGLSRELPSIDTSVHVKNTSGTIGYACRHYIKTATVSEATEIYSFGICILEFLTNQPPAVAEPLFPAKVRFLVDSIQGNLPQIARLVDHKAGWPDPVALQLGELILQCIAPNLSERPTFCSVVKKLRDLSERYSTPTALSNTAIQMHAPRERDVISDFLQKRAPMTEFKPVLPSLQLHAPTSVQSLLPVARNVQAEQWPSVVLEIAAFPKAVDTRYVAAEFTDNRLTVGRGHQAVVFNAILQSDQLRLCVSREHFRIQRLGAARAPRFTIENLSGNGTYIEGQGMLENKGDVTDIVSGDIIKLIQTNSIGMQLPFIQIAFTYDRRLLN